MNKKIVATLAFMIFIISSIADAYDNEDTHRRITKTAISASKLDNYLSQNLGFVKGWEDKIRGNTIMYWLIEGSYLEDIPACRAANHFHNPLLPWDQSYMTDQPSFIDAWCWDWKPLYSNVTWATGYYAPPPDGTKVSFSYFSSYDPYNWDRARDYYYKALTLTAKEDREIYFSLTFQTVGHVIHLLQDVSVPSHTRNDFQSHLYKNNQGFFSRYGFFDRYQPYEKYMKINPWLVSVANPAGNFPSFNNTRLTDFWDTNQYTGSNPSTATNIGLAEFSNANYFSDYTIPSNNPTTEHVFPRPSINNAEYQICTDYQHNSSDKRKYVSRKNKGACPPISTERKADHFATASLFNAESAITNSNISNLKLWLDNNVHNTYAKDLLPRAVGYSAGLLDYFFRGNIEITLPDSGVYAQTDNPAAGFTQITLLAKNTTPNNQQMNDGTIELVVGYRRAIDDPFRNYPEDYPFQAENEISYIVVPEINGIRSIPGDGSVELTFDFSQKPIPLWAINVFIRLIYHGRLGNEEGAVVVGFKDISEPTPMDFFNDMDQICLNGIMYTAGSAEAIEQGDTNHDGILDWDIYPHDLKDIYYKVSPVTNPQYASSANSNFVIPSLSAGYFVKASYILTDYTFTYNSYQTLIKTMREDPWYHPSWRTVLYPGIAIKNQVEYEEDPAVCAPMSAPCHIWWYPTFLDYRGVLSWWGGGIMFINNAYPENSECSCYQGVLRNCMSGTQTLKAADRVGNKTEVLREDSADGTAERNNAQMLPLTQKQRRILPDR